MVVTIGIISNRNNYYVMASLTIEVIVMHIFLTHEDLYNSFDKNVRNF